jgi:hypothetical protein
VKNPFKIVPEETKSRNDLSVEKEKLHRIGFFLV